MIYNMYTNAMNQTTYIFVTIFTEFKLIFRYPRIYTI